MQWLGVVDKIVTFPHFSDGLKKTFRNKGMNKIPEKTKRRAFSSNILKETDKRAYTTANVKLTINSVRANCLKREV